MTDETKKALTKYIGECWHEVIDSCEHPSEQRILYQCSCFEEIEDYGMTKHIQESNCTFTTPDDMHAVRKAIIERGSGRRLLISVWKSGQTQIAM